VHPAVVEKSPPSGGFGSTRAINFSLQPDLQNPAASAGFFIARLRLNPFRRWTND
jgi:hypothetical protein